MEYGGSIKPNLSILRKKLSLYHQFKIQDYVNITLIFPPLPTPSGGGGKLRKK